VALNVYKTQPHGEGKTTMASNLTHINEKHKDFLSILAYIYLKNNKFEKAIAVYKALWHLFPDSDRLTLCLGYLYLATHQYETALFYAETFLADNQEIGLGHLLKGRALYKLGKHFEAQKAIQQFLAAKR
jgi:tetratricopeptide (TPR) repeat protein